MNLICINNTKFPVNEIGPDLVLDKEYPLITKFKCGCGEEHYDVGLVNDINFVECYKCREELPTIFHNVSCVTDRKFEFGLTSKGQIFDL